MRFRCWLFTLLLLGSTTCSAADDAITVGAIIALTGEAASIGEACRNGISLALEDLSPELSKRVRVVYEDDENVTRETVSAFKRLAEKEHPSAIISFTSPPSKAVAPLADQFKIPLIAIATDPEVSRGRSHVVNLWATAEAEVRTAVQEAKKRGYKRIAIVGSVHDFSIAIRKEFVQQAEGAIEIASVNEIPPDQKDFRSLVARLKTDGKIDAILNALYIGQVGLFSRQAHELGLTVPQFGVEMFEKKEEVEISKGTLIGQWYTNADDGDAAFVSRYRTRFPNAAQLSSANCYDAIALVARAAEQGRPLNDFLHSVQDFKGALGNYSASGDNRFTLPTAIKVVTKDGFETVTPKG